MAGRLDCQPRPDHQQQSLMLQILLCNFWHQQLTVIIVSERQLRALQSLAWLHIVSNILPRHYARLYISANQCIQAWGHVYEIQSTRETVERLSAVDCASCNIFSLALQMMCKQVIACHQLSWVVWGERVSFLSNSTSWHGKSMLNKCTCGTILTLLHAYLSHDQHSCIAVLSAGICSNLLQNT